MDRGKESSFAASGSHDQNGHHARYIVKAHQNSSPEPKRKWPWGLVCGIWYIGPIKFERNDNLGLTLTFFTEQ